MMLSRALIVYYSYRGKGGFSRSIIVYNNMLVNTKQILDNIIGTYTQRLNCTNEVFKIEAESYRTWTHMIYIKTNRNNWHLVASIRLEDVISNG